jgi:hypothetical protein
MGKTSLMVNMALSDMENGHGVFFLDPHGDAIDDIVIRLPSTREKDVIILDPTNKYHAFGINLTSCKDVSDIHERSMAYNRAYGIFEQIWHAEFNERPWLQLITSHTLKVFIENQDYTLAEVPRFLRDETFRNDLVKNVKYNWEARDFWEYEFAQQRARDQEDKTDPTRTRLYILLAHEYVRDIIGQAQSTIDFSTIMRENKIVLLKLPANLSEDAKRFIGTILVNDLLLAILTRPSDKRHQFSVFVDEFQNFVASGSVDILITQARKFGIATTIAHQERFGQFSENQKIMGATAAAANKVFFQLAVNDARELAPEFAKAPTTTETRFEPKLVISQEPLFDLLKWGHANPKIQECIIKYLRPAYDNLDRLREEMETERLERMGSQDEATLYRDKAALSRAEGENIRQEYQSQTIHQVLLSSEALDRIESNLEQAMSSRNRAQAQSEKLLGLFRNFKHRRKRMRNIDRFLMALMDGRITPVPGNEDYAQFFIDTRGNVDVTLTYTDVYYLFIYLLFGNPKIPRSIPPILAAKYWPQQLEEAYMQENLEQLTEANRQGKVDQRQVQYFMDERMKKYREGKFSFESYLSGSITS